MSGEAGTELALAGAGNTVSSWRRAAGGAHPSGLLASTGRRASFCQILVFSQRPSIVTRGSNEDWLCLRHSAVPGISMPVEAPALARKGFLSLTRPRILWEGRQKGEVRSASSRRSQVGRRKEWAGMALTLGTRTSLDPGLRNLEQEGAGSWANSCEDAGGGAVLRSMRRA